MRKLPADIGDQVRRLLKHGKTRKEAAEILGVSGHTVLRHSAGIVVKPTNCKPERNAEIVSLAYAGVKYPEIAAKFSMSRHAVVSVCTRAGVSRPKGRNTERNSKVLEYAKSGVSKPKIAKKMGLPIGCVKSILKGVGFRYPPKCGKVNDRRTPEQIILDREVVIEVASSGFFSLDEIAKKTGFDKAFIARTLNAAGIQFRNTYGEQQVYQPTKPLIHVPSQDPKYGGFELEADMVEQLQKIRRRQRRMMARGEI